MIQQTLIRDITQEIEESDMAKKKRKKNIKGLKEPNLSPRRKFVDWMARRLNNLLYYQPKGLLPEEYALSVFVKNATFSHLSFTEKARHAGERRDILAEFEGEYVMGVGSIGAFRWFPMPDGTKELRMLIYEPYLTAHVSKRPKYNFHKSKTEWFIEDTWQDVYEIDDHIWITIKDSQIVNQEGDYIPVCVGMNVGFIAKSQKYDYADKYGLNDVFIFDIGVAIPVESANKDVVVAKMFPANKMDFKNHNYLWYDNRTRKFFVNKNFDNLYQKVVSSWHEKGGYLDGIYDAFSEYGFAISVEVLMLYDIEYLKRSIKVFGKNDPRVSGDIKRLAYLEIERKKNEKQRQ